jgi:hypothetical protein
VELNQVSEAQRQGTFQPKVLTLKQRLGLDEKPVEKPTEAYQDLLENNLNTGHAFKQGTLAVLLCKVLPSLLGLACLLGGAGAAKLMGKQQVINFCLKHMNLTEKEAVNLVFHPVVIAKTLALPVMGGFIAQQTVPWMRKQLGLPER